MFRLKWVTGAGLAVMWASFFGVPNSQGEQPLDLPPGSMQPQARTTCMSCHDAGIILQQRLSKAAWTKEVDKMIKWAPSVNPADRDALIDYLSVNFPPDKPAERSLRVRKGEKLAKAKGKI